MTHFADRVTVEDQLKATEELWHEADTRCGELQDRLEVMWAWIHGRSMREVFFLHEHPEAADWFDDEGRVK